MAEPNGNGKTCDHEERLGRLEAARKEMEDALVVMAHLESKSAARIKEHAEFIAEHEATLRSHSRFIASQEAAWRKHTEAMSEFDEKLNALIDIVGKMQGGMETRPS